uniref:DNA repair ATPase n=1 Tax=Candidatus Aramenus sulfurataquae TaxID=1326980 RepID=A0A0F2LKT6_9CREN
MAIDENRVREIVKEELESYFVKALAESVKELNLISQDLRQRQSAYDAKLDQALKELGELKEFVKNLAKVSEENTRATIELRKVSEENTRAIQELRKQTEENTKAIQELRKQTEENTRAIARLERAVEKLVKAVDSLNNRVGGLENTFGLVIEDLVREKLPSWFRQQGVEVKEVSGKVVQFENKHLEFDFYVEQGNKVYLGEVKVTLRERDVKRFYSKVELAKKVLKDKEVVPVLVYRFKAKKEIPKELAKAYGIKLLKYMKGGVFVEV